MNQKKDKTDDRILKILSSSSKPVDVETLIDKLKVNKTTIYRQIDKLLSKKIILDIELGDGKKRYELRSLEHHHHVVCKKCGKMEDVSFNEEFIISSLNKKTNFVIENHSMEFFGYCVDCK